MNSYEYGWRTEGRKVSPKEWRERIDKIQHDIVRIKVACIVYWDFFGDKPKRLHHLHNHLDDLLVEWHRSHSMNRELVIAGLVQVGYPPGVARARATIKLEDAYIKQERKNENAEDRP